MKIDKSKIHSYHNFLFPFRWEILNLKKENKKNNLKTFDNLKPINTNYWKKFNFEFKIEDNFQTYNDFAYFHNAVKDVLNLDGNQELINELQFEYNLSEHFDAPIYTIKTQNSNTYHLNIADIALNIYDNGIGVFSFHLYNCNYKDIQSILNINDFGRRIYPQFLDVNEPYINGPKSSLIQNTTNLLLKILTITTT